ncbi:hypothetical protein GOBAR_AA21083 [Gossypium barbadense]|uniref:Uncharacterized protein n=1 Tax=Gossypium barbadense TaxID=3634 RepID=A0A2P5X8B5_GOSBA|nr:hypothetical protein GOBAR_AA21083 [Gossypium barbadense]
MNELKLKVKESLIPGRGRSGDLLVVVLSPVIIRDTKVRGMARNILDPQRANMIEEEEFLERQPSRKNWLRGDYRPRSVLVQLKVWGKTNGSEVDEVEEVLLMIQDDIVETRRSNLESRFPEHGRGPRRVVVGFLGSVGTSGRIDFDIGYFLVDQLGKVSSEQRQTTTKNTYCVRWFVKRSTRPVTSELLAWFGAFHRNRTFLENQIPSDKTPSVRHKCTEFGCTQNPSKKSFVRPFVDRSLFGELLASVSEDSVRVWSFASGSEGECVHGLSRNGKKFLSCVFHPSFQSWLSLELWNMSENKTMTLSAHEGFIAALAVSPATRLVSSASHDKFVKLWK